MARKLDVPGCVVLAYAKVGDSRVVLVQRGQMFLTGIVEHGKLVYVNHHTRRPGAVEDFRHRAGVSA